MEENLKLIANNHMSLVLILGVLICMTGLVLSFLASGKTHGVVMVMVGIIFTSLPFITSVKFNKDGLELLTNTQKANEDIVKTLESHTRAIEEVRAGLTAVHAFSKNALTNLNVGGNEADFKNLGETLGLSISKTDTLLNGIAGQQKSLNDILKENNIILDKLGTNVQLP